MVEKIVTNAMDENVSSVGCSTKPVECSHAMSGSIETPEIRQNMNMKLTGGSSAASAAKPNRSPTAPC